MTLRVGVIGAGGIAPAHLSAWRELGAQVSILDRRGAAGLAAQYGLTVISDAHELIEAVDLVDIISPTAAHRDAALAAIDRGRHVVCEKPLATEAGVAAEIAQAASAAGVRLFPAHVVRYFGDYARAKQQVDAGAIGDLVELTFHRTVAAPDAPWFRDADTGGGLIRDLMIHDLDQAVWFAGPVVSVEASQSPPGGQVSIPATAQVVLTHASGAISRAHGTWGTAETVFRSRAEIVGTRGRLDVDSAAESDDPADVAPDADPYLLQLRDFTEAITERRDARVTPADGVLAVALVDAAYASLAAGAPVAFEAT